MESLLQLDYNIPCLIMIKLTPLLMNFFFCSNSLLTRHQGPSEYSSYRITLIETTILYRRSVVTLSPFLFPILFSFFFAPFFPSFFRWFDRYFCRFTRLVFSLRAPLMQLRRACFASSVACFSDPKSRPCPFSRFARPLF